MNLPKPKRGGRTAHHKEVKKMSDLMHKASMTKPSVKKPKIKTKKY
jgi:hypothetical protein